MHDRRPASLLHRRRRQAWKADNVTGGVDMLDPGLKRVVDPQAAFLICREPGVLERKPVGASNSSRGNKHDIRTDVLATFQNSTIWLRPLRSTWDTVLLRRNVVP